MKRVLGVLVGLVFLGVAHSAFAACALTSLTFKDASGATQTLCFGGSAGQFIPGYNILDSTGANIAAVDASGRFSINTTQLGGLAINLGTGNTGTGTQRVVLATDQPQLTNKLLVTADPLAAGSNTIGKVDLLGNTGSTLDAAVGNATAPTNMLAVGGVFNSSPLTLTNGQSSALQLDGTGVLKINCFVNCGLAQASTTSGQLGSLLQGAVTTAAPLYTTAQTDPVSLDVNGNLRVLQDPGCAGASILNTTTTAINNAGSSSNLKLVSKASSKNVYICSINLVAGSATNVALVNGTKTTNECDTSTAGMAGGATAATGWNLAANGGLTIGNGIGQIFKSTSQNFDVCLLFSAGNQVSGSITWAQF